MILRPYQVEAIHRAGQAFIAGQRRLLLVSPTGSGKTIIATEGFIRPALAARQRILFIAHRNELLTQCRDKLGLEADHVGLFKAGHKSTRAPLQIASVQTLARRSILPPAEIIIWDEAHHCTANHYQRIQALYPFAQHIGLTATPYRLDGRGLGHAFDALMPVASIADLIAQGYLVPARTFALPPPNLDGVRIVAGDYHEGDLATVMGKQRIGMRIVETYQRHASGRAAIVFAVSIIHSQDLCARFRAAGISAEHIDGSTPDDERAAILASYSAGNIKVLCNCQLLTEGYDAPHTDCIILARPTKSRCLWRQCIGRGMRAHPGKIDFQIHDHAGCYQRFGLPDAEEEYSLNDNVRIAPSQSAPSVRQCLNCYAIMPASAEICAACGKEFPTMKQEPPKGINVDLMEVIADKTANQIAAQAATQSNDNDCNWRHEIVTAVDATFDTNPAQFYSYLVEIAARRNYKPGWVSYKYQGKFGPIPGGFERLYRDVRLRQGIIAREKHERPIALASS